MSGGWDPVRIAVVAVVVVVALIVATLIAVGIEAFGQWAASAS